MSGKWVTDSTMAWCSACDWHLRREVGTTPLFHRRVVTEGLNHQRVTGHEVSIERAQLYRPAPVRSNKETDANG